MSTPDPLKGTDPVPNHAISREEHLIAGILTTVYGLDELGNKSKDVACLWLLHPRLSERSQMESIAQAAIVHWNMRLKERNPKDLSRGLIAVSFDQRNHGSRGLAPLANEAWKGGNPKHAQDMFSIYQGTAADTSQLITYLGAYIFPHGQHTLVEHMVLGVSLGGHATWHCILHDSRISTGVIVIGCPDYLMLMKDRARLSKLKTWTETSPPGSGFVGSADFPKHLVDAVDAYDPAGVFLGPIAGRTDETYTREPTAEEKQKLIPLMAEKLCGKRILNLAGGADKLVPYAQGAPFLQWLKRAIATDGWFKNNDIVLKDMVFDGVGHAMTPAMVKEAVSFMTESLEQAESRVLESSSKI